MPIDRQHYDLVQLVPLRDASARIRQIREARPKTLNTLARNTTRQRRAAFDSKRFHNVLVRFS
jgi:hypothetical protein